MLVNKKTPGSREAYQAPGIAAKAQVLDQQLKPSIRESTRGKRESFRTFDRDSRVLKVRSSHYQKDRPSMMRQSRGFNTPGEPLVEDMDQFDEQTFNDLDMETILAQIKGHDSEFDRDDKTRVYKEIAFYFKPAMNEKEEKDYDALNLETYIILTERFIYCIDIENLEWLFDPIPISNIATV